MGAYEIEIHNFKSFRGTQYWSISEGFVAIVGASSAGKVDFIDALSFVLDVQTERFSDEDLGDLIEIPTLTDEGGKQIEPISAAVTLKWRLLTGETLLFTRSICTRDIQKWSIDKNPVGRDMYRAKLEAVRIPADARKFMVFQGVLESFALRTPEKLAMLFEQVIHSDEDLKLYVEVERKKDEADVQFEAAKKKLNNISKQLKAKSEEKSALENYNKMKIELKSAKENYYNWQLTCLDNHKLPFQTFVGTENPRETKDEQIIDTIEINLLEMKKAAFAKEIQISKLKEEISLQEELENSKNKSEGMIVIQWLTDEHAQLMAKKEEVTRQLKTSSVTSFSFFCLEFEAVKDLEENLLQLKYRKQKLELRIREREQKLEVMDTLIDKYEQEKREATDVIKNVNASIRENEVSRPEIEKQLKVMRFEEFEASMSSWLTVKINHAMSEKGVINEDLSLLKKENDALKSKISKIKGRLNEFENVEVSERLILINGQIMMLQSWLEYEQGQKNTSKDIDKKNMEELKQSLTENLAQLQNINKEISGTSSLLLNFLNAMRASSHTEVSGDKKESIFEKLIRKKEDIQSRLNIDDFFLSSETVDIDFVLGDDELKLSKTEHEVRISHLTSLLGGEYIHLEGPDQYLRLVDKKKSAVKEFEDVYLIWKQTNEEYLNANTKRVERFNEAYKHLSQEIEQNYRRLTGSASAQARVSLLDNGAPFKGINYIAIPRERKYVWNMEQLSVRDTTVAALAFLFSVYSFKLPPIFILDEVDAALEDHTASKVAEYIKSFWDTKKCQTLVVSRKRSLYDKGSTLISVYAKDGYTETAKVNLRRCITLNIDGSSGVGEVGPSKSNEATKADPSKQM